MREHTRKQKTRAIVRLVLSCCLGASEVIVASSAKAEEHSLATPVTRQEVWQAVAEELGRRGFSEQQLPRVDDLDLPVAPPARVGRKLRVSSSCWNEGQRQRRTQFRVECTEPGACLPFLVYLRNPGHDSADAGASARTASCRLQSEVRPVSAAAPKPTVRAGERAMAVFIADRLRMTASVTCLERGREGEVIRVRAVDGHIFRARISGPALLEALPQ